MEIEVFATRILGSLVVVAILAFAKVTIKHSNKLTLLGAKMDSIEEKVHDIRDWIKVIYENSNKDPRP